MHRSWPLALVFAAIFLLQACLLVAGHDWYPDVVARVAAARDVVGAGWSLLMCAVVISPALLLAAPYPIAVAAARALQGQHLRLAS